MNNLWIFLGFANIFYLLCSINGEPFNGTQWLTELSDPIYEQQLQNLKLENENLKLRLENHNIQTERKLERIEDHLRKLDQRLTFLILNISANAINAKEDVEDGTNLNSPDDGGKKDVPMGDKDQPVSCIRNADKNRVCSDGVLPTNCANCLKNPCRIHNHILGPDSFIVPCNDNTDGGGWTVIQRRVNDSVDFYRYWLHYKQGFGDLDGNYWIGLDKLHALTTTLAPVELRIELMDFDNVVKYAKYDSFLVGDESTKYTLQNVGGYSGTAGDSFSSHRGCKFSTKDQDNDQGTGSRHCAKETHGGWWYDNCYSSNLNSQYYNHSYVIYAGMGIVWKDFHGDNYSLKFVQMMIRPKWR